MAGSCSASSNAFLLTTAPHSKLVLRTPRQLTVFAKNAGPFPSFRLGKSSGGDSSSEDTQAGNNTTFNPFQFSWGNLSDVKSLIPVISNPPSLVGPGRRKDAGTVFVAGGMGQFGVRVAQMLLKQGFRVRAGVSDLGAAQDLARFASDYKIISPQELKRLNAVESTMEDAEAIAKAIGNASKVVVTIGPTENGPTKEVTTYDALQVVEAAQLAGVSHVAIIYDDSTSMPSSTYNVLDGISSFFNNLFSKSQSLTIAEFLEGVIQTDVKYTFIKTTLTDDFSPESSYNVVVTAEGSADSNDYKVPRSQMAALVANIFSNTEIAEDKVVKVYTNPSAPLKSVDELFSNFISSMDPAIGRIREGHSTSCFRKFVMKYFSQIRGGNLSIYDLPKLKNSYFSSVIPEDGRRKAYAEAVEKAKAEEEATRAAEQAREAAEAKKKLEEEAKNLSEQEALAASLAKEAKQKAREAGNWGFSWEKLGSQFADAVKTPNFEIPKVQIATVRGQEKAQKLPAQNAVVKKPNSRSKPKPSPVVSKEEENKEVKNIFGGLFKQQTIYVDDD